VCVIKDWLKPFFCLFPTFLTPIVDLASSSPPPALCPIRPKRHTTRKKGNIETNIIANYIRYILTLLQLDITYAPLYTGAGFDV